MVAPHESEINLDAYARLFVALDGAGPRRDEVLAANGLEEDRWQAIDDAWQARLSAAMDAVTDQDPVPAFIDEYSRAMERARLAGPQPVPFEVYVAATRALRTSADPTVALQQLGMTLADYARANAYWLRRMIDDDDLAQRFQQDVG